jgi:transposase
MGPRVVAWAPGGAAPAWSRNRSPRSALTGKPRVRHHRGREPNSEVRELDARLKKITTEMSRVLAEHGTRLIELDGVGPVVAARLLGRTRHDDRFASASAFANYAGVAPVEVASAQKARHPLPRGGDRQLNLALHVAGESARKRGHETPLALTSRGLATSAARRGVARRTRDRNARLI